MGYYDQLFKEIFSDKEMLVEFINLFVKKLKNYDIQPENITIEKTKFTDLKYGDRESDLLFKIKYEENELFLYLIIEHQSSVDYLMQFRILEYMVRIWKKYINENKEQSKRKSFKLPPIIPVVFYNGKRRWTAENWFMRKIINWEEFSVYVPQFKYEIIDLSQIEEKDLLKAKNALSLLLAVEKLDKEEISKSLKEIKEVLEKLPENEKEKFGEYINGIIKVLVKREKIIDTDIEFEEIKEVNYMFENFVRTVEEAIKESKEKAKIEGLEEGRREGLEEGRKEGRKEGKEESRREIAKKLLLKKFGNKIESIIYKLDYADNDVIEKIIDNIFDIEFQDIEKILKKIEN
ncbi:hypothetical protein Marpi_1798 [Marinitoga piezophila KA3]|uniref:Transposase (putative) YhgA-like domain-containing protein n=1 Tax=Marinitoga piezophila (strain DSM 14283 / JCM 11233 / KA3) TaxID=443254 RepID=H2J5W0_MARPK|nr:Rpn family recombination-promoting nuclease/putative transposase [Marinitoga piezophila]AEX86179.1 hypothetical protein Marpi_1798 [Marinitoga piezophila KA3]